MTARKRRWWLPVTVATTGVALLTVGVLGATGLLSPASGASVPDMAGHQVMIDPGVVPDTATTKAMQVAPVAGARFHVPSVGLDVPLSGLNAVDGVITPPGFQDAYWVRNRGTTLDHPENGTVYVVMHSVRGGGVGPGNYLINIDEGQAKVGVGAVIEVDGTSYQVTGSRSVLKTQLAADSSVWDNTANRLVVITCLQRPDGSPSVDNMVITATRTAGG